MFEIRLFIDWLMISFTSLWNFFTEQHPIVQAVVFLPLAVMIFSLFIKFAKLSRGGGV